MLPGLEIFNRNDFEKEEACEICCQQVSEDVDTDHKICAECQEKLRLCGIDDFFQFTVRGKPTPSLLTECQIDPGFCAFYKSPLLHTSKWKMKLVHRGPFSLVFARQRPYAVVQINNINAGIYTLQLQHEDMPKRIECTILSDDTVLFNPASVKLTSWDRLFEEKGLLKNNNILADDVFFAFGPWGVKFKKRRIVLISDGCKIVLREDSIMWNRKRLTYKFVEDYKLSSQ